MFSVESCLNLRYVWSNQENLRDISILTLGNYYQYRLFGKQLGKLIATDRTLTKGVRTSLAVKKLIYAAKGIDEAMEDQILQKRDEERREQTEDNERGKEGRGGR